MALKDAAHILLTSYKPERTATVERIVEADDQRVGFWTPNGEELSARFQQPQTVTVQVCDRGGKPDAMEPLLEGTAEVVTSGELFDQIKQRTQDKYGFGLSLEEFGDKVAEVFGKKTPEAVLVINIVG